MKRAAILPPLLCALLFAAPAAAREPGDYIAEAQHLVEGGKRAEAVTLLTEAVAEHPEHSNLYAFLGLYTGMGAGETQDYMEAGRLMMLSFEQLDTSIELDPANPRGYLYRGIMGINVPEFLGRFDAGIADLEKAVELYGTDRDPAAIEGLVTAWGSLAKAYGKKMDIPARRAALEKIVAVAGDSPAAAQAQEAIDALDAAPAPAAGEAAPDDTGELLAPSANDSEAVAAARDRLRESPGDAARLMALARALHDDERWKETRKALEVHNAVDPENAAAYELLARTIGKIAEVGYDDQIHEDTDYRSRLAFEAMAAMDRAVELAPNEMRLRFMRGAYGILFPFFLGKHDQGVADLEMVADSDAPDSLRSEALYYLGVAKKIEASRYWTDVVKKHPGSPGARMALDDMRPAVPALDPDAAKPPFVEIDVSIGFQDQLPPQTAIWIEKGNEEYVATVYVSGFAGFVKEKQVTLPVWAAVSNFEGIDGVTTASIDIGRHLFAWDCTDYACRRVPDGEYTVRVETTHWPTNLYQNVAATIRIGGDEQRRVVVEEGDFIPRLAVTWRPE
ncbi:MAG: DUF2271 domain-containing protein [Candidatus Krumholzibacteriota bacterium]|nr:DUF2271 domain-containing protein [Candidatus Krumholzibacteriota bacterium]